MDSSLPKYLLIILNYTTKVGILLYSTTVNLYIYIYLQVTALPAQHDNGNHKFNVARFQWVLNYNRDGRTAMGSVQRLHHYSVTLKYTDLDPYRILRLKPINRVAQPYYFGYLVNRIWAPRYLF